LFYTPRLLGRNQLSQGGILAEALRQQLAALISRRSPSTAPRSERYAATTAAVRQQLGPADRLAFDQALASVGSRRHAADPEALARTTFDGMAGAEIAEDYRRRQR
jgi:hypothetical protein